MNASGAPICAYVGLGSNLHQPVKQVRRALRELHDLKDSRRLRYSNLYVSAPLGPPGQADYVNAVAELQTRLTPLELLDALQKLEARHGRRREVHWGSRTLDLDILLYGDSTFRHDRLQIPHPELAQRAFALYPLSEIVPDLNAPGLGRVRDLRDACPAWPTMRLTE